MFYDERIEREKGRISACAIILAVVLSAMLGAVRLANILRNAGGGKYLVFVLPEGTVFLSGLVCLAIGFFLGRNKIKDERTASLRSRYYGKAAPVLIGIAAAVFALFYPVSLWTGRPNGYVDNGFGHVFFVLFFLVGMYVVYAFRKKDVYFNYSLMESGRYYRGVFANIGKLAIRFLLLFALSVCSLFLCFAAKKEDEAFLLGVLVRVAAVYACILLGLSLLYLLCSFLEKTSYDSRRNISPATLISAGVTVAIYCVYTAAVAVVQAFSKTQVQAVQSVSFVSFLMPYVNFAAMMFLTYFDYEYRKRKRNSLFSSACLIFILGKVFSFLAGQLISEFTFLILPEIVGSSETAAYVSLAVFYVKYAVSGLSDLAVFAGTSLLIVALVRDGRIGKSHLAAIAVFVLFFAIDAFLRVQAGIVPATLFRAFAEIVEYSHFFLLALRSGGREETDCPEETPLPAP